MHLDNSNKAAASTLPEPAAAGAPRPAPGARYIALPHAPGYTGNSENTLRRLHAEEVQAGRAGFLVKAGRSTLLDVARWEAFISPRVLINQLDRRPRKDQLHQEHAA